MVGFYFALLKQMWVWKIEENKKGQLGRLDKKQDNGNQTWELNISLTLQIMEIEVFKLWENEIDHALLLNRQEYGYALFGINGLINCH